MKKIEVVAAIIRKGDRILATQRGYGAWKDWWEFPGGKMEPGESPQEALAREIREELDAEIRIGRLLRTVEWDYPEFHLTMHCYLCTLAQEALHLNEHESARWLDAASLDAVRWLPADDQLLPLIRQELSFDLSREGLIAALESKDPAFNQALLEAGYQQKIASVGPVVYLRGLIEISNVCAKNCLYCGIRREMDCPRYELSDEQVLQAATAAAKRHYGSVVIQGGERKDKAFRDRITRLVKAIKAIDTGNDPPLGITLSLGEQPREVYEEWFAAGAHRYLLRIESSNPDLYRRIHPDDDLHSYDRRLQCLYDLREIGYQAGTGAMIGMPFQTSADLADDLLFYRRFGAPMIGMGPYNPHPGSPLTLSGAPFPPDEDRFMLGLKMIALLRLLMPDINIAAATALEVLDPRGREMGIMAGANVFMPNVTPAEEMVKYNLYDRKTILKDCPSAGKGENHICRNCVFPVCSLGDNLQQGRIVIGYGQWGDSKAAKNNKQSDIP